MARPIPVITHLTANAAKGEYPLGFADGVSITVVERAGRHRLLRSAGKPWTIGEVVEIMSDQSRRYMGTFTVVGHAIPDTGEQVGTVPNRKLPMMHVK